MVRLIYMESRFKQFKKDFFYGLYLSTMDDELLSSTLNAMDKHDIKRIFFTVLTVIFLLFLPFLLIGIWSYSLLM